MADFLLDGLTFSSQFDSGNLGNVERTEARDPDSGRLRTVYQLSVSPDCAGTQYQSKYAMWYFFSISGLRRGQTVELKVMNLNKVCKVYCQDLAPIVRVVPSSPQWVRHAGAVRYETENEHLRLSWTHVCEAGQQTAFFAFNFPYAFRTVQRFLGTLDERFSGRTKADEGIYYHRELLCRSVDGHPVDLLTISSRRGLEADEEPPLPGEGLQPSPEPPARRFRGKPGVFISARVHPGETMASFLFEGFVRFLLDPVDSRAAQLRDRFVFKLVPVLNPDGVVRGHYRCDVFGVNLNRAYLSPHPRFQPSIYAAKAVMRQMTTSLDGGLFFFLDMHAYAAKPGVYVIGNQNDAFYAEQLALAKLMSLHSPLFNYAACSFGRRGGRRRRSSTATATGSLRRELAALHAGDGRLRGNDYRLSDAEVHQEIKDWQRFKSREATGEQDKEGTGRVAVWKEFGVLHSYTAECSSNRANAGSKAVPQEFIMASRAIALALLELSATVVPAQQHTISCLPHSEFESLDGLRQWAAAAAASRTSSSSSSSSSRSSSSRSSSRSRSRSRSRSLTNRIASRRSTVAVGKGVVGLSGDLDGEARAQERVRQFRRSLDAVRLPPARKPVALKPRRPAESWDRDRTATLPLSFRRASTSRAR